MSQLGGGGNTVAPPPLYAYARRLLGMQNITDVYDIIAMFFLQKKAMTNLRYNFVYMYICTYLYIV